MDALITREEQEKIRHIEQLRREGREHFKVYFNGPIKRIHALKTIAVKELPQIDGSVEYSVEESTGVVEPPELKPNPVTGRFEAWVYADPDDYNLFWLARNMDDFKLAVEDEVFAKKIEACRTKEFKMPDTRRDQLLVEKRRIDRELRKMDELEKQKQEKVNKIQAKDMKAGRPRLEPVRPDSNKPEQVKV